MAATTLCAPLQQPALLSPERRPDRPCFHIAPREGWINDPNGPLYYKGYYHVFYQYVPTGCNWAWGLAWGHAVSKDLVNWEHLPPALVPTPGGFDGDGCFSGCATLDVDGTPTILYTGVRLSTSESCGPLPPPECQVIGGSCIETQCIAVAADPDDPKLEVWTKSDYPFLALPPPNMGLTAWRDPYVLCRPGEGGQEDWTIMIGSGVRDRGGTALVYRAKDLKGPWEYTGELCRGQGDTGVIWECPVMLHLPLLPSKTAARAGNGSPQPPVINISASAATIPAAAGRYGSRDSGGACSPAAPLPPPLSPGRIRSLTSSPYGRRGGGHTPAVAKGQEQLEAAAPPSPMRSPQRWSLPRTPLPAAGPHSSPQRDSVTADCQLTAPPSLLTPPTAYDHTQIQGLLTPPGANPSSPAPPPPPPPWSLPQPTPAHLPTPQNSPADRAFSAPVPAVTSHVPKVVAEEKEEVAAPDSSGGALAPAPAWQRHQTLFCVCPDDCTKMAVYYLGSYDKDKAMYDLEGAYGPYPIDLGDVFYAPNTLVDPRGRSIMWGWLQDKPRPVGSYDYACCLSLPRAMWLEPLDPGPDGSGPAACLYQQPLPDLAALRVPGSTWRADGLVVQSDSRHCVATVGHAPHVEIQITMQPAAPHDAKASPAPSQQQHCHHQHAAAAAPGGGGCSSGVLLHSWQAAKAIGAALLYHWSSGVLEVVFEALDPETLAFSLAAPGARCVGGKLLRPPPPGSPLSLRIFLDYSVLEVFTGGGEVLTTRVYRAACGEGADGLPPLECASGVELVSYGGDTEFVHAAAHEMSSHWDEHNLMRECC